MNHPEEEQALTLEERLKAIAYQFVMLYERWSEDRQAAVKQSADLADLIKVFATQVKNLKALEPNVRQQIMASIQHAAAGVAKVIGEETSKAANRELESTAGLLANTVSQAQRTLNAYEQTVASSQFKFFAITVATALFMGLLTVWLLIPKPQLALTDAQMSIYQEGKIMNKFWDKLSKKEQNRLLKIANGQQDFDTNAETTDGSETPNNNF